MLECEYFLVRFFFFKQKTAYEMRISDWSSDVCSSDLMFLADAYAALDYLATRPEIDAGRVALVGFSYGGMVATYAAYAQVAERYAPNGRRFAAHVAF